MINYVGDTRILGSLIGVTGLIFNFKSISVAEKNRYLKRYSNIKLKNRSHEPLEDVFYSPFVTLAHYTSSNIVRYTKKINKLFVPKFYHDRKNSNFKKNFKYIGEKNKIDDFSEISESGRKLYEYQRNTDLSDFNVNINTQDRHFPKKYFKSVGYTVHGFKFLSPKVKTPISDILNPIKIY